MSWSEGQIERSDENNFSSIAGASSILKINIPIGRIRIAFFMHMSYPFRLQFKAASRSSLCISIYIISALPWSAQTADLADVQKEVGMGRWPDHYEVLPRPKLNRVIMMEGWPGMSAWVSLSPHHFRFFIVFSGPHRTFTFWFWDSSQLFRVNPIQQDVNVLSLQEITNLK